MVTRAEGEAAPLTQPELGAWLRLLETPGVGRLSARRLLAAFGSPQEVLAASVAARRGVVPASAAQALAQPPEAFEALLERTSRWLDGGARRSILTLGDPCFPPALLELADPPLLLYAEGDLGLLAAPALAVVGSRNPSAQGTQNARAFCSALSEAGIVVVSGLAMGIDAAAHEGALDGPSGTVAVLGTGLDVIYPRRNTALADRIAARGLLLSEYSLGTPPIAAHFPLRNRLIAGLSLGTLVVEAALQSGSLITARLAAEAGREVFAIPGSIHSPQAKGCHALIKQGAKLVESTQDILEELRQVATGRAGLAAARQLQALRPPAEQRAPVPVAPTDDASPQPAVGPADDAEADPVLRALGWSPATLEVLQVRSGLSASELSVRLLELELLGQVARLPGQLFQRQAAA